MQSNKISIKAKDDTNIPAITYNIEGEPVRGIVIVCHGFGEHSGMYEELADYLSRANYATVVFDQRGHGKLSEESPKKRRKLCGVIPGYQTLLDDIDAVIATIKEKAQNTPIVLFGHSMGGNIVANYLLRHSQFKFSCAALESPWLGLHESISPPPLDLIKVLGCLFPNMPLPKKLTALPLSSITSDKRKQKEFCDDPLYHNRMTMRMFSDICNGCIYALDKASQLTIPIFLAYAQEEKIVSNEAIFKFSSSCGSDVTMERYESHHSIHNDKNREVLYRNLINYLNAYCPSI